MASSVKTEYPLTLISISVTTCKLKKTTSIPSVTQTARISNHVCYNTFYWNRGHIPRQDLQRNSTFTWFRNFMDTESCTEQNNHTEVFYLR